VSSAGYPDSTYYAASSNNYTSADRPSSHPIDKIVIHVTQGSWSGSLNWFSNPNAGVSAHYTVRSDDGFIGQSVHEKDIAYHAGNWPYNQTSVGIEHEGYVSDPSWFTEDMYRSSARLTAYLCKKYAIPADRQHILGHNEVPEATHTDPGQYWDWDKYMGYVRDYLAYSRVVDNEDPENFAAASRYWSSSSYSSQRYGTNYRFAKPATTTRNARFRVPLPETASYKVYAWWPATSGYNDRTRFRIRTTGGFVTRVVNQRRHGGRWVLLGTYEMEGGSYWCVQVSNRSRRSGYIIADAVKIVQA
jgi:N-acetyl-anhydromuramyl-L-alanine amidase AmpD